MVGEAQKECEDRVRQKIRMIKKGGKQVKRESFIYKEMFFSHA